MKIEVSIKDLENIKSVIILINNEIYKDNFISEYNNELLKRLLGTNWKEEYLIGDSYIEEKELGYEEV